MTEDNKTMTPLSAGWDLNTPLQSRFVCVFRTFPLGNHRRRNGLKLMSHRTPTSSSFRFRSSANFSWNIWGRMACVRDSVVRISAWVSQKIICRSLNPVIAIHVLLQITPLKSQHQLNVLH